MGPKAKESVRLASVIVPVVLVLSLGILISLGALPDTYYRLVYILSTGLLIYAINRGYYDYKRKRLAETEALLEAEKKKTLQVVASEKEKNLKELEEKKGRTKYELEIERQKKLKELEIERQKKLEELEIEKKAIKERTKELKIKNELFVSRLPNILHESVPYGKDEADNKVVRKWGRIPNPKFEILNHGELIEKKGLANFDDAAKVSGKGFYYLLGDFALLQGYMVQMFGQLWDMGRHIKNIYSRLGDAEEMTAILKSPHEVVDKQGAGKLQVLGGRIEFKDVTFAYHEGGRVFKNFNLSIKPGERVALIGPSGGGKTTIVKLLFRFFDILKPLVIASARPLSFSETHLIRPEYFFRIDTVSSVELPSITIYSILG